MPLPLHWANVNEQVYDLPSRLFCNSQDKDVSDCVSEGDEDI